MLDERCVWMDAGVVSFKLCDRNFDCEACPLDVSLRHLRVVPVPPAEGTRTRTVEAELPAGTDEEAARLLAPFRTCAVRIDRRYAAGGLWVRFANDGPAFLGVDGLVSLLLPPGIGVRFPASDGQHLRTGDTFCTLSYEDRALDLPIPFDARLVSMNRGVSAGPAILARQPFDLGWLAAVEPADPAAARRATGSPTDGSRRALAGLAAFLGESVRRLHPSLAGSCLNDGGRPVRSIDEAIGGARRFDLLLAALAAARARPRGL
jgi:glycine cleavage system H lipoate-binding protein